MKVPDGEEAALNRVDDDDERHAGADLEWQEQPWVDGEVDLQALADTVCHRCGGKGHIARNCGTVGFLQEKE